MGLQISIRQSSDVTILDVRGRAVLDEGEGQVLGSNLERLVAGGVRKVLLNLTDVTQLDSSGVTFIVRAHRFLHGQGG